MYYAIYRPYGRWDVFPAGEQWTGAPTGGEYRYING